MAGSWFFDENFNGVSEEFFDKVIESLDFPLEDVDVNAGAEDWNAKFQCLEPPSMDILTGLPSETSKLHRSFHSPYSRTSQLKQSTETTSSSSAPLSDESSDVKYKFPFKTSSPVSILENSSSHSVENSRGFETKPQIAVKRARSKRTRLPRFNKQFTLPFVSPASSASEKMYSLALSESESDSILTEKRSKHVKRKQKKRNLLHLSGVEMRKQSTQTQECGETKKCMHCEVTSTPQWREGPMGPKTLCNACGVRYRSGRLFPEYRPAASPTFIPSVHSNSHKKVIEMRNNTIQVTPRANVSTLSSPQLGNSVR